MRIICLSAESADICHRLDAWDHVVAVSAFARQEGVERRPVISGFSTADVDRIAACNPDLIITFSDVQAGIAAELIRAGFNVLATNQRTLADIPAAIRMIGGIIGRASRAEEIAAEFTAELESLRSRATHRPRVYFEEWPDPLVCGIGWVSDIVELAGGDDIFKGRRGKAARERFVGIEEVVAADPEIILASWCGKPVNARQITSRKGFRTITAVRNRQIHVLDSSIILQPGPRVLEGARMIRGVLDRAVVAAQ